MASDAPEGLCARCLLSAAVKEPTGPAVEATEAPSPGEIARFFPQLEILELLGRGGMGVVYKARQLQLDRIVALKILPPDAGSDPQFAERFGREARALARLSHPNIVGVHDFGQSEGLFYLIMEFVDGANLRQLMRAGQVAPAEALAIVPRICEALQFAHDEGIMHRDIKPENILIDKKGRVKIADFGLAKLLGRDAADLTLTQAGMSVGTPKYMAPEQVEHPDSVDHRADIYSLGVVFYEMLTGELPIGRFAAPSHKAQIDVRLDEIVLRSLEKDVERRYQHVSEVKSDVDELSGAYDKLPANLRRMMGFEYHSKATLFGWPLVHVVSGMDPRTGHARVARGIIACGDRAVGFVAFGGLTLGVFAFGGIGIGLVTFSGMSLGLISMGGFAVGLLFAYGGVAVAPYALGGMAVGYVAAGGAAWGAHVTSGVSEDPIAVAFFRKWWGPIGTLFYVLLPLVIFVPIGVQIWSKRRALRDTPSSSSTPSNPTRASAPAPAKSGWLKLAWTVLALILIVPALAIVALIVPSCSAWRQRELSATDRMLAPVIREERGAVSEPAPGRQEFAYRFQAPIHHRLRIWRETWNDGERTVDPQFSFIFQPPQSRPLEMQLRLTLVDGQVTTPEGAGKMRLDWRLTGSGATLTPGAWLAHWSRDLPATSSTWGMHERRTVKTGDTVTVLALRAAQDASTLQSAPTDTVLREAKGSAAMLVKARFEPVPPDQAPASLFVTGAPVED